MRLRTSCIMSANPAGIIKSQISDEELNRYRRRAKFERDYKRNQVALLMIKNKSTELENYSKGVAASIERFRKSRRQ